MAIGISEDIQLPFWVGTYVVLLLAIGRYIQNIKPRPHTHTHTHTPMCSMGHTYQLLFSRVVQEMPLTLSRLGVSICPLYGAVENRRFLMQVWMIPVGPRGYN